MSSDIKNAKKGMLKSWTATARMLKLPSIRSATQPRELKKADTLEKEDKKSNTVEMTSCKPVPIASILRDKYNAKKSPHASVDEQVSDPVDLSNHSILSSDTQASAAPTQVQSDVDEFPVFYCEADVDDGELFTTGLSGDIAYSSNEIVSSASFDAEERELRFGALSPLHNSVFRNGSFRIGGYHPVTLDGRLYFVIHKDSHHTFNEILRDKKSFFWSSDIHDDGYMSFCDDFGPNNISQVHRFIDRVNSYMLDSRLKHRSIIYYSYDDDRHVTNATFLLAVYLMLEYGYSAEDAHTQMCVPFGKKILTFRDATWTPQTYGLSVLSCLQGLSHARTIGWYDPRTFDTKLYDMWLNPIAEDMTLVGDKFIAFRGPRGRSRSPIYYRDTFKTIGVSDVVRLNNADSYDRREFINVGLKHHDLYFGDCTTQSDDIVERFLDICDTADGLVAVHCLAGLGRTGTLIALWMMKHKKFLPECAIGFLRLLRPGSIIGPQQHYLSDCKSRGFVGNRLGPLVVEHRRDVPDQQSREMAKQVESAIHIRTQTSASKSRRFSCTTGACKSGNTKSLIKQYEATHFSSSCPNVSFCTGNLK